MMGTPPGGHWDSAVQDEADDAGGQSMAGPEGAAAPIPSTSTPESHKLTLDSHKRMLSGFAALGFKAVEVPSIIANPIRLSFDHEGRQYRYRLWTFAITRGGNNRDDDERRIQITNAPEPDPLEGATDEDGYAAYDRDGVIDLLMGYSERWGGQIVVGLDRRWMEKRTISNVRSGVSHGSPSIQFPQEDIDSALRDGFVRKEKQAALKLDQPGKVPADVVLMRPEYLPSYLMNYKAALGGTMTASDLQPSTTDSSPAAETLVSFCAVRGFPFGEELIARYLASALTKPLVILAGISGTGKSKLAELVAEFYGTRSGTASPAASTASTASAAEPSVGSEFVFESSGATVATSPGHRFALVPVRPDWTDNQSILGFVNPITDTYESTQALDLILRAAAALKSSPDRAAAPRHFMLLDEMNLARVEHYFSDWLACTESRRPTIGGGVRQEGVPLHRSAQRQVAKTQNAAGPGEEFEIPQVLELPTNLIVTGTVNVDETTHGFSPKVLDRAFVLEFDDVDLSQLRSGAPAAEGGTGYRIPVDLPPFELPSREHYAALPEGAHSLLIKMNRILEEARLHIGYRSANEIALFMRIYNDMLPEDPEDSDWHRALDVAILQKVLPRLSGSRSKLEKPLADLCGFLSDPFGKVAEDHQFDKYDTALLAKSYRRAVDMLDDLKAFGFVSFFK